jgi:insulysin
VVESIFDARKAKMFNGMKFDTFTLDNKLEVLAISDSRFVKSSAALAVMAGSMQNPEEHLGLAHFLEHMLFLGTQDYPQVGEYEDYLNKHGGGHNAYTSIDHTNYFFDVIHDGFEGALKRFSRFFVNPTFDSKYVEREINAVHSEHEKNLQEDGRREYRFQQIVTDPQHPFSKFATGDKETLKNANRDVVMNFYKSNYSSNLMRLVIMSNKSSKELSELAKKYFSDVPNAQIKIPEYEDRMFSLNHQPQFHKVESIRDQDILKLSFDMPDDHPYWQSKPTSFLAHLVGEEGEGSLLSYLKKQGWAYGLQTSTWWRMFHFRINLTELGKKEYQSVIKACFSFIELIKKEGLKDYIYYERKVLAQVDLDNIEPKSSMERASDFSASMLYYPVNDFLNRHYLYHEYSPKEFNIFLDKLVPSNMEVTLFTKESFGENKEAYYGIAYNTQKLSESFLKELETIEIYNEFIYPEPNPYLPTDLSLVETTRGQKEHEEFYKKYSKLYSKVDTDLKVPKGSLSMSFISNIINGDPKKYIIAKLYSKLKKEELNEWGYPARLAGLNFNISHGYNTITIDVSGFSQHLPHLIEDLLLDEKHIRRIDEVQISNEVFERVKKNYKRSLINKEQDAAYQQLLVEVAHLFSSASIHRNDYIPLIDSITLKEVNDFAKNFFSKVAIRTYCFGNLDPEKVKPIIDNYFKNIGQSGFTIDEIVDFENKYVQIDEESLAFCFDGPNNNNSQISFYKMSPWSICEQAHMDVLSKMIEQPYFTELRTQQQLGYVVAAFGSSSHGFCGLGTLIQTQNFQATEAYTKSNHFMYNLLSELQNKISHQDVEDIKNSILSEILQKPNSLSERMSRFMMMSGTYHGDYEFLNKLAHEIKKITTESLQQRIGHFLKHTKAKEAQICLIYNGVDSQEKGIPQGFRKVTDINSFKGNCIKIQPYRYKK